MDHFIPMSVMSSSFDKEAKAFMQQVECRGIKAIGDPKDTYSNKFHNHPERQRNRISQHLCGGVLDNIFPLYTKFYTSRFNGSGKIIIIIIIIILLLLLLLLNNILILPWFFLYSHLSHHFQSVSSVRRPKDWAPENTTIPLVLRGLYKVFYHDFFTLQTMP